MKIFLFNIQQNRHKYWNVTGYWTCAPLYILWQSLRHSLTNCSINLCGSILFIRRSDGSPRSASNLAHEMSVCSYHCHVNQFNGEGWMAASPRTARAKPACQHIHTPSPNPPLHHWGAKWRDRTSTPVTGFVLGEHEGYDRVFLARGLRDRRGGEQRWESLVLCTVDVSLTLRCCSHWFTAPAEYSKLYSRCTVYRFIFSVSFL